MSDVCDVFSNKILSSFSKSHEGHGQQPIVLEDVCWTPLKTTIQEEVSIVWQWGYSTLILWHSSEFQAMKIK